jgi:hypothetical protein
LLESGAFETTIFSLSTEVPRPAERRLDERLLTMLPTAKLVIGNEQHLCRVRNISAGGLLAETLNRHEVGTAVRVEFNSHQHLPGEVVWTRETSCGIKFEQNVDLRELLANRPARGSGHRPRPPRLYISCSAALDIDGIRYRTQISDISLGGLKVAISDWNCVGKDVTVTLESLGTIRGTIKWYKSGKAGIVFAKPLPFEHLAEWMGKRVEAASLKAGAWTGGSKV